MMLWPIRVFLYICDPFRHTSRCQHATARRLRAILTSNGQGSEFFALRGRMTVYPYNLVFPELPSEMSEEERVCEEWNRDIVAGHFPSELLPFVEDYERFHAARGNVRCVFSPDVRFRKRGHREQMIDRVCSE